jgi:hypothetical protein
MKKEKIYISDSRAVLKEYHIIYICSTSKDSELSWDETLDTDYSKKEARCTWKRNRQLIVFFVKLSIELTILS